MASTEDELHWRETYFILFPQSQRPSMEIVEHALGEANCRMQLENLASNEQGLIESLLIESPEDHAAVEVSYEVGDAVIEQNLEWAKQLQSQLPAEQLQLLMTCDARLDVAHFERLPAGAPIPGAKPKGERDIGFAEEFGDDGLDEPDFDEEAMDMLDPTCLLTVVETLAALTHGITFDPAAGELLE